MSICRLVSPSVHPSIGNIFFQTTEIEWKWQRMFVWTNSVFLFLFHLNSATAHTRGNFNYDPSIWWRRTASSQVTSVNKQSVSTTESSLEQLSKKVKLYFKKNVFNLSSPDFSHYDNFELCFIYKLAKAQCTWTLANEDESGPKV